VFEGPRGVPDLGPAAAGDTPLIGQAGLEQRLAAVEQQLGRLTGFIGAQLRPALSASAFSPEAQLSDEGTAALRPEIEQRVADAATAKAELDGPYW
jgi:hypothetical protein